MNNRGYCSFTVKGHDMDFNEIEQEIKIEASKKIIEGEEISKVLGKNKFDLISFDKAIDEENRIPNDVLEELLDLILSSKKYVRELQKKYDVFVKCFMQSDYAQMSYRLSPTVIKKLAELNIDFEISILSWGGADE